MRMARVAACRAELALGRAQAAAQSKASRAEDPPQARLLPVSSTWSRPCASGGLPVHAVRVERRNWPIQEPGCPECIRVGA
jgi:hypothetical protein